MEKTTKGLKDNLPILLLFIIGILVFANSIFNGFVIDDFEVLVNNALVHSPKNLTQFFEGGAFSRGSATNLYGQHYRPVMLTILSIIYNTFGANPFYFHFFQVILFILNSVLVYLLFCRFFTKKTSFVLAVLFLVHPINLLPAVFVGSIGDTLFLFFGLIATLLILSKKEPGFLNLSLIGILLLLSVLSKETGTLFFITVFLTGVFFQKKHIWKIFVTTLIPGLTYLFLRLIVVNAPIFISSFAPIQKATFFEKLLSIPAILSYYISHLFIPWNLSMFQHWVVKSPNLTNFYLPLFLMTLFFFVLFILIKKFKTKENFKEILYFLTWFLIGCVFVLPFWPIDMTVSDRWFYFPVIGILGLVGIFAKNIKVKNGRLVVILLIIFIGALGIRTQFRNSDWKDNLTLATRDIKHSPDSFELQNLYGIELAKSGNLSDGELYLKKSVDNLPYGVNINNLASVYLAKGDTDLAIETFKKSAENGYYKAYENVASLLMINKAPEEAFEEVKKYIEMFPGNSTLWQIMALIQLKAEDRAEALVSAEKFNQLAKTVNSKKFLELIKNGTTYSQFIKK